MEYVYYILDDGEGRPLELYRAQSGGKLLSESGLERIKADGSWSSADKDINELINRWLIGDFDPVADGVSEREALKILADWKEKGWPGRN